MDWILIGSPLAGWDGKVLKNWACQLDISASCWQSAALTSFYFFSDCHINKSSDHLGGVVLSQCDFHARIKHADPSLLHVVCMHKNILDAYRTNSISKLRVFSNFVVKKCVPFWIKPHQIYSASCTSNALDINADLPCWLQKSLSLSSNIGLSTHAFHIFH